MVNIKSYELYEIATKERNVSEEKRKTEVVILICVEYRT